MKLVLFLCKGNVGRSQIAEAYYNYFLGERRAISAGVKHGRYLFKHPVKEVVEIMLEDGIDISSKPVKRVTLKMALGVKNIFILCEKSLCPSFITKLPNVKYIEFADPQGKSISDLRKIRNDIKQFVSNLIKNDRKKFS